MLIFWIAGLFSLMIAALATIQFLFKLGSRIELSKELEKEMNIAIV